MNLNRQQGFSLIESLITLAILGIGLAGSAKLQTLVLTRLLDNKAQNEAMQFAIEQLETLRYQTQYEAAIPRFPLSTNHQGIHSDYHLRVTDTTEGNEQNLQRIEVVTRWQTPGTEGQLVLESYFTQQPTTHLLYRLSDAQ